MAQDEGAVFRAESVRRRDHLQCLAGALEVNHRLLVRVGTVVMDLDGEALDVDRSVGKGTKDTLSNDIKDTRRECACQCDGKVDQGSERNPRYIRDQLAATNLAQGQLCSVMKQFSYQMQKTHVFSESVLCREGSAKTPSKVGRKRSIGL